MAERWLYGWALGSIALGGASLVVPLYVVELGGGPFVLGLLAAVAAIVGVPGALGFGRIADRTGKRRGLVLGALALVTLAIAAIPFLGSVNAVIVANGVIWFAFAAATPVLTLLAVSGAPEATWSQRIALLNKYQGIGWAIGLLVGALWTGLGTYLLPPELVIPSLFGPLAVCAAVGFLIGGRTLPPDPDPKRGPGVSGARIRRALQRADRFSVRAATFPFTVGRADFRGLHPRRFVERFSPTLALYFVAVFLFFSGFSAFFAPLPAYLTETGFGSDAIFALYLTSSVASAVCFGAVGRLTSKREVTLLQVIGLSARGVLLPAVALVGTALGATAVGFGAVFALFTLIGVTWAVIAVTGGTLVTQLSPATIRGEALGMYAALGALAGGVGSLIGGWLAAGSYTVAFLAAGGFVVLGALIVVIVRRLANAASETTA